MWQEFAPCGAVETATFPDAAFTDEIDICREYRFFEVCGLILPASFRIVDDPVLLLLVQHEPGYKPPIPNPVLLVQFSRGLEGA